LKLQKPAKKPKPNKTHGVGFVKNVFLNPDYCRPRQCSQLCIVLVTKSNHPTDNVFNYVKSIKEKPTHRCWS